MGLMFSFASLCLVAGELVFKVCSGSSMGGVPEQCRERGSGMASWTLGAVGLRSVAVARGIRAKIGDRWLPVAQLRSALMEALAPTEQAQSLCFGYR